MEFRVVAHGSDTTTALRGVALKAASLDLRLRAYGCTTWIHTKAENKLVWLSKSSILPAPTWLIDKSSSVRLPTKESERGPCSMLAETV